MSGGDINATELVASLINQKENLIEGIQYALESIDGSLSLLLLNQAGIYAARDKHGRTPVVIGRKEGAFCASFENFAYKNLGYSDYKELGPGEVAVLTPKNCVTLVHPGKEMKICTFLWIYYGYPASSYEGLSVEQMRYNCGAKWRPAIMSALILLPVYLTPVPPMPSVMLMLPEYLSPDLLSNIHRPGPVPLCQPSRASVT